QAEFPSWLASVRHTLPAPYPRAAACTKSLDDPSVRRAPRLFDATIQLANRLSYAAHLVDQAVAHRIGANDCSSDISGQFSRLEHELLEPFLRYARVARNKAN